MPFDLAEHRARKSDLAAKVRVGPAADRATTISVCGPQGWVAAELSPWEVGTLMFQLSGLRLPHTSPSTHSQ